VTHAVALRQAGWRHPEGGAAVLAAGAWVALAAPWLGGGAHAAHARLHEAAPVAAAAAGWLLMTTAMMVPTALPMARHLALTGLWRRRQRTIALFLGSYLAVWALFGAVALPVLALAGAGAWLPGLLLAAAAWELTRAKWRAVRSCRLVAPLPPDGRVADAACCATGLRYGRRCVVACWPLMLVMAAAGHGRLGLMALLAAIVAAEKLAAEPGRLARPAAVLVALSAATTMAV
jgi:predicted metal-binding membrane protein